MPWTSRWTTLSRYRTTPPASPVFRSEEELADTPWLLLDVCDHGIILFDPRAVLACKLASLRLRLRELGSRRIELADGSWYWDLKPDLRPARSSRCSGGT